MFANSSFDATIGLLRKQNLNVDSRVTVAKRSDANHAFELYDVYRTLFRRNGKLHVTLSGHWNAGKGVLAICGESLYDRRQDFENIELQVIFTVSLNGTVVSTWLLIWATKVS